MSYGEGAGTQGDTLSRLKGRDRDPHAMIKNNFSLIFDLNCVAAALILDGLTSVLVEISPAPIKKQLVERHLKLSPSLDASTGEAT